jgi:hypothetical protein
MRKTGGWLGAAGVAGLVATVSPTEWAMIIPVIGIVLAVLIVVCTMCWCAVHGRNPGKAGDVLLDLFSVIFGRSKQQ